MFKEDAENEDVSYPMRIEAYFASAFHIIEACCALHNIHINKHSMVRRILEGNPRYLEKKPEGSGSFFRE